ncbi:MAG: dinitrogenase iron-molybdenum cofactor biosynthesis protein [Deltaproteobacteria bacterium]|nr:dinitrogenase iron-molybdenum cofactor biosynthesis protein [Deltaproteobacteria bacterium]MBW1846760.1 dinitrogenase iron-molybdenum cofactor biosynthesis protein [Deltaproteobacteria bacterium]MBW2180694.1 dinitrogenase iron-molybdenum cofactor biosynthesis protein [Deltaproteobacteria bacterium]MBW2364658.1 dinitrogenase iron-molybdenum cofactor biosynthesis protein [Deltaproteobacteria bacterium]
MSEKILITLYGNDVSPRFDLTTEVLIVNMDKKSGKHEEKIVVLPQSSSEQLCNLIIKEGIQTVICGGVEDEYYQYLKWKKVEILDSVIGSYKHVLNRFIEGSIQPGEIVHALKEKV